MEPFSNVSLAPTAVARTKCPFSAVLPQSQKYMVYIEFIRRAGILKCTPSGICSDWRHQTARFCDMPA